MDDKSVTEPVAKRADQLVVGDRILPEFLPAAARGPGEALYVRLYTYGGDPWVFVAFLLPDGLVEAAHYLPDRKVEVYPAPDATGQLYSRADDGETTQPIAGRTPPHYGEVIDVDLVVEGGRSATPLAGGLIEIDPPEGFVPASTGGLAQIHFGLLGSGTACGLPAGSAGLGQVSAWAGVTCPGCLAEMPGSANVSARYCQDGWHDTEVGDQPSACPACGERD